MKQQHKVILVSALLLVLISALIIVNAETIIDKNANNAAANIPYSAIFGKNIGYIDVKTTLLPGAWQNLTNYTFYLPVDSYVYTEVSGQLILYQTAQIWFNMDDSLGLNADTWRSYGVCDYICPNGNVGPNGNDFHLSKVYYLTKGIHTIYVKGAFNTFDDGTGAKTYIKDMSIAVLANQIGKVEIK